ncbi:hypothetical protein [Streptomyces sp. NPDC055632]
MKPITALVPPVAVAATLLLGFVAPVHAAPYWNKSIKCSAADPDGRKILTRVDNGELGWNHLSGKHNIKKYALVDILLQGNVDRVSGADIQYWGRATNRAYGLVKLIVKVRYTRKTAHGRYDAVPGPVVGVITAYCNGMQKCPHWVNE